MDQSLINRPKSHSTHCPAHLAAPSPFHTLMEYNLCRSVYFIAEVKCLCCVVQEICCSRSSVSRDLNLDMTRKDHVTGTESSASCPFIAKIDKINLAHIHLQVRGVPPLVQMKG